MTTTIPHLKNCWPARLPRHRSRSRSSNRTAATGMLPGSSGRSRRIPTTRPGTGNARSGRSNAAGCVSSGNWTMSAAVPRPGRVPTSITASSGTSSSGICGISKTRSATTNRRPPGNPRRLIAMRTTIRWMRRGPWMPCRNWTTIDARHVAEKPVAIQLRKIDILNRRGTRHAVSTTPPV